MGIQVENPDVLIGFGLFAVSELVGMSRMRDNSIVQVILRVCSELFPYELQRREPPSSTRRTRRDSRGRYIASDEE